MRRFCFQKGMKASRSLQQRRTFLCIIPEYCRSVRFNFGRFTEVVKPGLRLDLPFYHHHHVVSIAHQTVPLQQQEMVSRDNVSFVADALLQYQVEDPKKSLLNVKDCKTSLCNVAQLTIREFLSTMNIDDILHNREELSNNMKESMRDLETHWGVRVHRLQIRDIRIDETMRRALAKSAEAEQLRRAKIINAEADIATAEMYAKAAELLKDSNAMKLREMDLMTQVSREPGNTITFVPSALFEWFQKK